MSLVKTWYTLEEAEAKFGLKEEQILQWVDAGVVRSEQENDGSLRINVEDLALQIGEVPSP